jgi:plasmid maintenance system antidote protein VapI
MLLEEFLQPMGLAQRELADGIRVLRGGLLASGENVLVASVSLTPVLLRGAAETHNR